jgi:beta-D-xylosidase 4
MINITSRPSSAAKFDCCTLYPYLTSAYVEQYVTGLQFGPDQRYLKMVACCKHFSAYDLENWNGTDRFHFNAIVSDQDFAEV